VVGADRSPHHCLHPSRPIHRVTRIAVEQNCRVLSRVQGYVPLQEPSARHQSVHDVSPEWISQHEPLGLPLLGVPYNGRSFDIHNAEVYELKGDRYFNPKRQLVELHSKCHPCFAVWRMQLRYGESGRDLYNRTPHDQSHTHTRPSVLPTSNGEQETESGRSLRGHAQPASASSNDRAIATVGGGQMDFESSEDFKMSHIRCWYNVMCAVLQRYSTDSRSLSALCRFSPAPPLRSTPPYSLVVRL